MEPIKIERRKQRGAAGSKSVKGKSAARGPVAVGRIAPAPFAQSLARAQVESIRKELDALLEQIDGQAKVIEQSLTFDTLRAYKELVRKFVNIVVHELYEVQERMSVSPTGRKKSMILVKKLDVELEKLSSDFLNGQSSLINFMARLEDIKGMLMDLYS
jgi:uncharacterized protein YaaR (DUF327 family)